MKKIFTILSLAMLYSMGSAQIVINEVYGGGGNSGSTYKNDFIELINNGSSVITITGATLQYATAGGTFNQYHALPSITLNPGQIYLIQESSGAGGSVDLNADFIAPVPSAFGTGTYTKAGFVMAATDGKIALVSNGMQITSPTDSNVLDFVGYGEASQFEGSGAAPSPSAKKSIARTNGADSNNNATDFIAGEPDPQNFLGLSDLIKSKIKLVKNTKVGNAIVFSQKANIQIMNISGQVLKSAAVSHNTSLDVSTLPKGVYFIKAEVDGQKVSQKILKN